MSVRSNGYCFTLNNYTDEETQSIVDIKCNYIIFGREVGESGTPHLQGYVQFGAPGKTLSAMKKLIPRAHFEVTKGSIDQNVAYCSKEGDFTERGVKPMSQKRKGVCGKDSLEARWEKAKEGRFQELPPEQIKTYEYIYRKFAPASDRDVLDNLWIQGPSGCGKSKYVRDNYEEFYSKPMSKWWDGYEREETVLLDDYDPSHTKFLAYFLKTWADHYVFNAEVKGGMMRIRPKTIIITSQYSIDECFESPQEIDAIKRRFKVITLGEVPQPYAPIFNRQSTARK